VVMSSAGFIVRVTIVVPDLVGAFIAMVPLSWSLGAVVSDT